MKTIIRPSYSCCHPNAKGTGCAVRFELHPAHDNTEGSIFVTFAAQKAVSSCKDGNKIFPTFDWSNRITVRLNVLEVAAMLEVFRGYREKMGDGKGLFHTTGNASTIITLEHRLEPEPGYAFGVSRKTANGELKRLKVTFNICQALALTDSLSGALVFMAFGIPRVFERAQNASSTAQTDIPEIQKSTASETMFEGEKRKCVKE